MNLSLHSLSECLDFVCACLSYSLLKPYWVVHLTDLLWSGVLAGQGDIFRLCNFTSAGDKEARVGLIPSNEIW